MSDKVVLRRWKGKDGGDVIALFPEQPADEYGRSVNSYMHVGQHGEADYDHVISQTTPVLWWGEDVESLIAELKTIGYDPDVRMRRTPDMREACRAEAQRLRVEA